MTADENLLGIYRQVVPNHQVAILRHVDWRIVTFSTQWNCRRMETEFTGGNVISTEGARQSFKSSN
jgi:hypothetical protein